MAEFKLSDYPQSVQELADMAVSIMKIDTGVEWTASVETVKWDAKIIMIQGNFGWIIQYSPMDKMIDFLGQLISLYYIYERRKGINNADKAQGGDTH